MDGRHVLEAAGACQVLLGVAADRDWARPIPEMDWTVAHGFAAMACDELAEGRSGIDAASLAMQLRQALRMRVGHTQPAFSVHTDDAARGLGVPFVPPDGLVRATLARLFPWAPGTDPWPALLWCNGRIALPGHPRQDRWAWHCAPLEEWDGRNPADRR